MSEKIISRRKRNEVWSNDIPSELKNEWGYPAAEHFSFSRCVWVSETEYNTLWVAHEKDWEMME